MSLLERYRELYEYEKHSNNKMLAMLESVPEANRSDARFQRAVSLAYHLVACRENFLDFMDGKGKNQVPWNDEQCDLSTLRPRFAAIESQWTDYLVRLEEDQMTQNFELIVSDEEIYRYPIEVQMEQMVGHTLYHRGQMVLLVDQLGGETVDTDYVDWAYLRSIGQV